MEKDSQIPDADKEKKKNQPDTGAPRKTPWFEFLFPGLIILLLDRAVKAFWLLMTEGLDLDFARAIDEHQSELPWFVRLALKLNDGIVKVYSLFSGSDAQTDAIQPQVTQNSGMAFGWFQGNSTAILVISVLLVAACMILIRKLKPTGLAPVALSLIVGGAIGNMIDRVAYGYVIDMFPFFGWFVFNVADVGVVAGVILCGISLLFRPQDWSNA